MAEAEISIDTKIFGKLFLLAFLVIIFILETNVTLKSPIAFGDEAYHVSGARWIGTNVEYPVYTPLHGSALHPERFNRLPLWNFMEASFYMLFGFKPAIVQVLVPLLSLFTGLAIYAFGRKLFSEELAIIAAIIAVTIPSFVTYSVLFYTTVPYVFFFSLAFLTFLYSLKTHSRKFLWISAMFSTIAILVNLAGLFMPVLYAFVAFAEIINNAYKKQLLFKFIFNLDVLKVIFETLKRYSPVFLFLLIFISPWILRNFSLYKVEGCTSIRDLIQGNCRELQTYTPTQSFAGRTGAGGSETGILEFGILNYLRFAYGFGANPVIPNVNQFALIWLHVAGVAFIPVAFLAGLFVLWKMRGKVELSLVLSALLFLFWFVQLGGFGTGRAEDTARYFLSATPLIGLVCASYFSSYIDFAKKFVSSKLVKVSLLVLTGATFVFLSYFNLIQFGLSLVSISFLALFAAAVIIPFLIKGKGFELLIIFTTLAFAIFFSYANFSQKLDTMSRVKQFSSLFFEGCNWIKQNTPEKAIFFSLQTYPTMYNCDRQAVWEVPEKADILLSNNVVTVVQTLKANGITHIFVQKFSLSGTAYSQSYPIDFVNLVDSNTNAFKKIYENGPTVDVCARQGGCDGGIVYEVL